MNNRYNTIDETPSDYYDVCTSVPGSAEAVEGFADYIEKESCRKMFCNYQGIMMGETGQIWFSEVQNEAGEWEMKIIALNGFIG